MKRCQALGRGRNASETYRNARSPGLKSNGVSALDFFDQKQPIIVVLNRDLLIYRS